MSLLANALFTKTQQKILGLLYTQPDKTFYTNEIIRTTGMGVATIKRELDRMVAADILSLTKIGNQHHYQARKDGLIYAEIHSIVIKTFGISGVIKQALEPLSKEIDSAFIFGSIASGSETMNSDIDLMLVGNLSFSGVVGATYETQQVLGREINPKIYSREEWNKRVDAKDAFILNVLSKPYMEVMGNINELR